MNTTRINASKHQKGNKSQLEQKKELLEKQKSIRNKYTGLAKKEKESKE